MECKDVVELVLEIITAVGIIVAVLSLFINIRASYFSTIQKCTGEYRVIIRKIQRYGKAKIGENEEKIIKNDLLGLFNEQLYYIKFGYIPREMKLEWMETMHNSLLNKDEKINNFNKDDFQKFTRVEEYLKFINNTTEQDVKKNIEEIYIRHYKTSILMQIFKR